MNDVIEYNARIEWNLGLILTNLRENGEKIKKANQMDILNIRVITHIALESNVDVV